MIIKVLGNLFRLAVALTEKPKAPPEPAAVVPTVGSSFKRQSGVTQAAFIRAMVELALDRLDVDHNGALVGPYTAPLKAVIDELEGEA